MRIPDCLLRKLVGMRKGGSLEQGFQYGFYIEIFKEVRIVARYVPILKS